VTMDCSPAADVMLLAKNMRVVHDNRKRYMEIVSRKLCNHEHGWLCHGLCGIDTGITPRLRMTYCDCHCLDIPLFVKHERLILSTN
jgi:hypothetical protein